MALSENNGHMILFIWLLYAYGENHFIQDALWMPIKFMYKFPHNIIYDSSFLFNVFILFNSKSLILFQKSLPNIHNHLCLVLQWSMHVLQLRFEPSLEKLKISTIYIVSDTCSFNCPPSPDTCMNFFDIHIYLYLYIYIYVCYVLCAVLL